MTCPACERGTINDTTRRCDRCHIGVPQGTRPDFADPRGQPRRRPDQNERYGMADYAETKRDKA